MSFISLITKGGKGSGNFKHAGRKGQRGGSAPVHEFFAGNVHDRSIRIDEIYKNSSPEVREFADKTGFIAGDSQALYYIRSNVKKFNVNPNFNRTDYFEYTQLALTSTTPQLISSNATISSIKAAADPNTIPYFAASVIRAMANNDKFMTGSLAGDIVPVPDDYQTKILTKLAETIANESDPTHSLHRQIRNAMYVLTPKEHADFLEYANRAEAMCLFYAYTASPLISEILDESSRKKVQEDVKRFMSENQLGDSETLGQYAKRLSTHQDFPELVTDDRKVPIDKMSVLSTVHDADLKALHSTYADTWDRDLHSQFSGDIGGVYQIRNPDAVEDAYRERAETINNVVDHMWHGTSTNASSMILSNGFQASKSGMFGVGVYLTDCSSKATQYIGGGSSKFGHNSERGAVLLCSAAMGNSVVADVSIDDFDTLEANTVFGKKGVSGVRNNEWAVKDPKAVVPRYYFDVIRNHTDTTQPKNDPTTASLERVRMKSLIQVLQVLKGGKGSGNWGHAGRIGHRGGSTKRSEAMSMRTGRDAHRRQAAAAEERKGSIHYFKGNIADPNVKIEDIYNASSPEIQELATATGVIATDSASKAYIQANKSLFDTRDKFGPQDIQNIFDDMIKNGTKLGRYGVNDSIEGYTNHLSNANVFSWEIEDHVMQEAGKTTIRRYNYDARIEDLTPDENRVLNSLIPYATKAHGLRGARMLKFLESMPDADKQILRRLQAKRSFKEAISSFKNRAIHSSNMRDWKIKSDLEGKLDALIKANAVNPHETLMQYGMRIAAHPEFPSINTDDAIAPVSAMIALASVTSAEKSDLVTNVTNAWDKDAHYTFTNDIQHAFRIKSNTDMNTKFDQAIKKYGNVMNHMYHGTGADSAQKIAANGYKASNGGMFGPGVYVTNVSSKASQYLKGGASAFGRGEAEGVLLVNDVAMGKVVTEDPTREGGAIRVKKPSFGRKHRYSTTYNPPDPTYLKDKKEADTIYGKKGVSGVVNDEWVVRDSVAVVPRYWLAVARKSTA